MYDHLTPSQMHIKYIKVGRHSSQKKINVYIADAEYAPQTNLFPYTNAIPLRVTKSPCPVLIVVLDGEKQLKGQRQRLKWRDNLGKKSKKKSRRKSASKFNFFSLHSRLCEKKCSHTFCTFLSCLWQTPIDLHSLCC